MPPGTIHLAAPVTIVGDDLLIVRGADGVRALGSRLLPLVLPLVDGVRSVGDIADALEPQATIADVIVAVEELTEAGAVVESPPSGWPVASPENDAPPGSWLAIGSVAEDIARAFVARIHAADPTAIGNTLIVVADDYASSDVAAVNAARIDDGRPWLLVQPLGAVPWIGPLFEPANGSPCWRCLELRLREAYPVSAFLVRHSRAAVVSTYAPRVIAPALARAAAITAGAVRQREHRLLTFDSRSGAVRSHEVVARPDCPTCRAGAVARRNTNRNAACPPAALPAAALARRISPVTGIVSHVSSTSCGATWVAVADHLFAPELEYDDAAWRGFRRRTAAAGTTAAAAELAAVAESIERYSGVYRESDAGCRASYAALGRRAIHPNSVMGFSERQFAGRDRWNEERPERATRVPEPFDEAVDCAWTALRRLGSDEERWLPTACCYFGSSLPERRSCPADSNGCAAGATFADATVRGFLELVERDAVGIWWHNRITRAGVDLPTIDDGTLASVIRDHLRLNRRLRVLDITTDLGVPAFAALASDDDGGRLTIGFGAGFSPREALLHALLEIGLFLPELAAGRQRAIFSGPPPSGAYLEAAVVRPWETWTAKSAPAPASAIAHVEAIAEAAGLEVYVLDQSRADAGLPVARVVIPGLCHFWPRFAFRRLYSVPVALDPRRMPTREDALNETAIVI